MTANNTHRLSLLGFIKSKFAIQLWAIMMLFVFFSILFQWFVQIPLIEDSYISAMVEQSEQNVNLLKKDLNSDNKDENLASLSKSIGGKAYLVDADGTIISIFAAGVPGVIVDENMKKFHGVNLESVLSGETIKNISDKSVPIMTVDMGIPIAYNEQPAAIFLYYTLPEINAIRTASRNQLLALSAVMTLVGSLLAIFFTRQVTRPIHKINNTVNAMAEGDLTATPDVHRSDELGQLSESVTELGTSLQKVDVLRKEVIANVSHELRAPLSLILAYGEMVRDISGNDEASRTGHMNLIIRETGRLSQMVDDIMDYSQFQAGYTTLNYTNCNLYELVYRQVEFMKENAAGYGIAIDLDSYSRNIPAKIDEIKISQVIRNLLNNAVNHTESNKRIAVAISQDAGVITVSVRNPGEPIDEEARKYIWERYYRAQHEGCRKEGTGIGLAIVSTILDAHEMKYGVDCRDGYNNFWFCFLR